MRRGSLMNPPTGVLPFEMFRSFGPMFGSWPITAWTPPCEISETDKEIVLKVELPKAKPEALEVTLDDNVLMIKGEQTFEDKTDRKNDHRTDECYSQFMRSFTLSPDVDSAKINAEFKGGLLTVKLPKHEEARPKHIKVEIH